MLVHSKAGVLDAFCNISRLGPIENTYSLWPITAEASGEVCVCVHEQRAASGEGVLLVFLVLPTIQLHRPLPNVNNSTQSLIKVNYLRWCSMCTVFNVGYVGDIL